MSRTPPPPPGIFWTNFIRALEAEPQEVRSIQGASGIEHSVIVAGVDAARRRLILVSHESDARAAAMMQADIQSAFRSVQVLIVRLLALSSDEFARAVSGEKAHDADTKEFLGRYAAWMRQQPGIRVIPDDLLEDWASAHLSQLSGRLTRIRWDRSETAFEPFPSAQGAAERKGDGDRHESLLDILKGVDPMEQDRRMGLCPLPVYEFSTVEFEHLQEDSGPEAFKEILYRRHLLQYFFPSADHLVLGLLDLLKVRTVPQLIDRLIKTPDLGHPFGPNELVPAQPSFRDMINELRDSGLVAGEELDLEITERGREIRAGVRLMPREGLLYKILNRVSASQNFKSSWLPILRLQRG